MSTTDHESPLASKVAPEDIALRASPRPVMRLNRRMLAVAMTVLAVVIAGASMWALQSKSRRAPSNPAELYHVDRIAKADELDRLPADYSQLPPKPAASAATSVPALGPPLPGDWGAASVAPLSMASNTDRGPSAESVDRQRQAEEVARSAVFFRASHAAGKTDGPAMTQVRTLPNTVAGPFNPVTTTSISPAAKPSDPTAMQNRQDQKEAFLAKGRMSDLLAKMPVQVILTQEAGLIGAAVHAQAVLS